MITQFYSPNMHPSLERFCEIFEHKSPIKIKRYANKLLNFRFYGYEINSCVYDLFDRMKKIKPIRARKIAIAMREKPFYWIYWLDDEREKQNSQTIKGREKK